MPLNKKDACQKLYELIEAHGECDMPGMHIIDVADMLCEGEGTFRVYHKDGYGFEVSKRIETDDEETGDPLTYYYDLDTYFDGFKEISAEEALKLIPKLKTNGK